MLQEEYLGQKKVEKSQKQKRKAVCLFSSAGIGELGIEAAGIHIVAANELIPYRVALYRENFNSEVVYEGDIRVIKNDVISAAKARLKGEELFLLYATPPCQGMSSNGMGKLKSEVNQGRRAEEDERNRLIIPTVDVLTELRPLWILLENVPGMRNTNIRVEENEYENIITYIQRRLGQEYEGCAEVVACQDYGIPQRRKRLITIFTRDQRGKEYFKSNGQTFFSKKMLEPLKTLRDAIGHLPPLEAKVGKNSNYNFHQQHYVPVMNSKKFWWIEHTKQGDTAFNNQCVKPGCGFTDTPGHQDILRDGKWVSSKEIPIHCAKCGSLLPRPTVETPDGEPRLLKGFHSAYRRMLWDEPATTLTQNFIYEASDNKVHPEQNRVLSIYEAIVLQTIDRYTYKFSVNGKDIGAAKIAEVIGESVPPYLIEKICKMMMSVSFDSVHPRSRQEPNLVFA
jgi:DNA (cytosine-5)-methyltransferase 1